VTTDLFDSPLQEFDVQWSPDSKWLTYTLQLENHMRGVFVYSLDSQKATQVTDGMSDAVFPVFDKNGKYLYFTASTNMGLSTGWLDMTSEAHPVTRSVYVAVLKKDLPSPLAPESDEEKPEAKKDDDAGKPSADGDKTKSSTDTDKAKSKEGEKKAEAVKVQIDFEGLSQRILALPIPARNYYGMSAGKEGVLFLLEGPLVDFEPGPSHFTIQRFELKTRKTEKIVDNVDSMDLSFNGEKLLYRQGKDWFINPADKPPQAGKGTLNTAAVEVYVVPREEWKQMYHEVWRIERDFFYDPHFHGLDIQKAEQAYAPFVAGLSSRADFNYLLAEMLSNINVLHMYVAGGKHPDIPVVSVGLLSISARR
jgi:tricorn protease